MNITVTEADNGSVVDVVVGARLNVFLKVPSQEVYRGECLWSHVTMSGDEALQEIQVAVLLPTGVTAAFLLAIRAGVVHLNAHRYDCSKGLITEWHVDVRVAEIK